MARTQGGPSNDTVDGTGELSARVDWDEGRGSSLPSLRTVVLAAALVAVAAVAVYDLRYVPTEFALTVRMTGRDYMLVAALAIAGWACAPLLRRPELPVRYWRRYPKDAPSLLGLGIVVAFVLVGLAGPLVMDPPVVEILKMNQPPAFASISEATVTNCHGEVRGGECHGTLDYPFGTDNSGRGVLAMVVFGARTALEMAVLVSMIAVPIAVTVGTTAAYVGGRVDDALMRYVDIQQIVPAFFIYIVLIFHYGASQALLIVVFGLFSWGGVARVVRAEVKREREEEYVLAAKNAGAGTLATIRRHIWPNIAATIVVAMTLQIPFLITIEAALSFIDLADEQVASWGKVIAYGWEYIDFRWWITGIPGAILTATVLGFYLLGDALQRMFDPKLE